jgi:hypothetical protein
MSLATADPAHADAPADALLARLQPLVDGPRLDTLVDLFALVADLLDFADPALVGRLAGTFEELVAAGSTAGGALRIASAEAGRRTDAPSARALWSLVRDADTRRGLGLLLRTLQIVGAQHRQAGGEMRQPPTDAAHQ